MFEKVNPGHPDKMADRLAGAVVDLVYERAGGLTKANPRVACEVMAGHGRVDVQIETSLGRMDHEDYQKSWDLYQFYPANKNDELFADFKKDIEQFIKDFDKEWKRRRANYIKRHGKDCV